MPADPVSLTPGETAPVPIRVVNPGPSPVAVRVTGQGVNLGDDGHVSFTGEPDPRWDGRTTFPSGVLTVPAQGFLDVSVSVHMPSDISPDLYYVGFLVTPVAQSTGSVVVVNQIGAFFTINVPGPRLRELTADLDVPGFQVGPLYISGLVVGEQVNGMLTTHNVGPSAIEFFGENDATSAPVSGTPSQQRIARSLLPIGRSRSFQVGALPAFPIDLVTMTVTVAYPNETDSATKQIVLTKTMLVISPWLIYCVCAIVGLLVCWRLYRRRARRRAASLPGRFAKARGR
ncbi:MAG: hypothetical protein JOY68_07310 [Candidatus Dormibacteraeota bacterium]|nr:hypothetical protein [Candidatus Dormibacteraeota bacterium]